MGNLTSQGSGSRSGNDTIAPRYLQRFFLTRLRRFVSVRRQRGPLLDAGDLDLRLLDRAVYSTFCDCLDLGVGEEARAILRNESAGVGDSETKEDASN